MRLVRNARLCVREIVLMVGGERQTVIANNPIVWSNAKSVNYTRHSNSSKRDIYGVKRTLYDSYRFAKHMSEYMLRAV